MLTITAVSAGSVEYLLHGSGCAEHEHAVELTQDQAQQLDGAGYLVASAEHEPAGVWYGRGLEMVGIAPGTQAAEADVRAVFGQLRHPGSTEKEPVFLGRPPRKFKSTRARIEAALAAEPDAGEERIREITNTVRADGRKPVAYYDLTFSPVKSVSVYYAALLSAGREVDAEAVLVAHREAIAEAMEYAEEQAAYTRTGYHGKTSDGRSVGVYEKAVGLEWIRFDHRTNRSQEPQVHSHVAVLNRVTTLSDGAVRALDGKGFRPIKQGIDALYRRSLERRLEARFGVVFAERPDGKAREIVGIDQQLLAQASSRGAQVEALRERAVAEFEEKYGRSPSPAQRKEMWNRAKLQERPEKTGEISPGQQLTNWYNDRRGALDSALHESAERAVQILADGHPDQREYAHRSREDMLQAAVDAVQAQYSTWFVGTLQDEIEKQQARTPSVTEPLTDLVDEVLRNSARYGFEMVSAGDPGPVPAALQRPDGKCRYRALNDEAYATQGQLQTEVGIVARARQLGAPALAGPDLELARVELIAAGLGLDQAAAALGILSSGRAGDVLIGPAGAGKSHTVGALARIWENHFAGRVVGLATSQIATSVLEADGLDAMNTTVFLQRFTPDERGLVADRVRPGDLFIVDEAGMSSTAELDQISQLVASGGGKLLFTGDHEQLVAVGAGGMLSLLVADNGAYELTEIHRFHSEWEREASIRLRDGDRAVLSDYERHGRIRGGTVEEMTDAAARGYLADTIAGKQSLLVVARNDDATELAAQIRAELVRLGRVDAEVLGRLRDGNFVGAGDRIQTRRNDSRLRVDGPGMVTNRAVYTVVGRDDATGELLARDANGLVAHLPAGYVAEHVTLAYASTVYAAQGRTVDTVHALIDPLMQRSAAYVALTRGRETNTAYVVSQREPDHHQVERLDSTALGILGEVLERTDDTAVAAELARRAGDEATRSLGLVGTQWDLLTTEYSRDRYTDVLAYLLGSALMETVAAEPGFNRLMRAVRAMELEGHDPEAVLAAAVSARSLADAESVSDVIRWRINVGQAGRVPERDVIPGDWTALTTPMDGPVGDYALLLAEAASARQTELGQRAAAEQPAWVVEHLGEPPLDQREHDEWVRRAGIVAAYRELAAIPDTSTSLGAAPSREQVFHRALWQQAYAALGAPADALDYATASDVELRSMRDEWRREATWAPWFVDDELRDARLVAEGYRQDAVLWRAQTELLPAGSMERGWAEAEVAGAERMAAECAARAAHLEVIASARAEWAARAAEARTRFELAGDELSRRGVPRDLRPPMGEQQELFPVLDAEDRTDRKPSRDAVADPQQLLLDLEVEQASPTTVVRAEASREVAEPQEVRDQQELEAEDDWLEAAVIDAAQGTLFTAEASAADVAAAAPLRGDPAAEREPVGGSAGEPGPVTVGEALRQAQISAALRAARAAGSEVVGAATIWELDRDELAQRQTEELSGARSPDRSERELGQEISEGIELGTGLGL